MMQTHDVYCVIHMRNFLDASFSSANFHIIYGQDAMSGARKLGPHQLIAFVTFGNIRGC